MLCNKCKDTKFESINSDEYFVHYDNLNALEKSCNEGCHLCSLMWQSFSTANEPSEDETKSTIYKALNLNNNTIVVQRTLTGWEILSSQKCANLDVLKWQKIPGLFIEMSLTISLTFDF